MKKTASIVKTEVKQDVLPDSIFATLEEALNPTRAAYKASYFTNFVDSLSKPSLDSTENNDEDEESYDSPVSTRGSKFRARGTDMSTILKDIYELYIKNDKNSFYIHKIIVCYFLGRLNNALSYSPKCLYPNSVRDILRKDVTRVVNDFDLYGLKWGETEISIITDLLNSVYEDTSESKLTYISIVTPSMLNNLLCTCIKKGITIDPEIMEEVKQIDFKELLLNGGALELRFLGSIKSLFYSSTLTEAYDMFSGLGRAHKYLNDMPDTMSKSELVEEDVISIDGKSFSKKAFESVTESDYDSFISNLEIETLLNKEDIAEDGVVEGKLNLM